MRVLVCGGRDYSERRTVNRAMAAIHEQTPISLVIEGGARGADLLAKLWAQHAKVPVCEFPANWGFEGSAAGPRQNAAMLKFSQPDLVVAFPRANGKWDNGTLDMVRRAHDAGVPVQRVGEPVTAP